MKLESIQTSFNLHVGGPTDLECALYAMLDEMEVEYLKEWSVPGTRYRVDAYAVGHGQAGRGQVGCGAARQGEEFYRIAYEADGPFHFTPQGRKRDKIRDARILNTGHVDRIVRLGYRELKSWL